MANYTQLDAKTGTSLALQQQSDKKPFESGFAIAEYAVNNGRSDKMESEGRRKGKKKSKKFYKKMLPAFLAFGAMKLMLFHFLIKKALFISFGAFALSTISFVLASLVAAKQFFSTPTQHKNTDSHQVEIVQIPIRKHRDNKPFETDYDESKLIPVTFEPETSVETKVSDLPYKKPTETFISSEEDFKGIYSEGLASDIYESGKFSDNINDRPIEVVDFSDDENYNGIYSNKNKFVLIKSDQNHISMPFI